MDEDATECGENCSFEDGKGWDGHHISSWMSRVRTRQMAQDQARTWDPLAQKSTQTFRRIGVGGTNTQRSESVATRTTQIL